MTFVCGSDSPAPAVPGAHTLPFPPTPLPQGEVVWGFALLLLLPPYESPSSWESCPHCLVHQGVTLGPFAPPHSPLNISQSLSLSKLSVLISGMDRAGLAVRGKSPQAPIRAQNYSVRCERPMSVPENNQNILPSMVPPASLTSRQTGRADLSPLHVCTHAHAHICTPTYAHQAECFPPELNIFAFQSHPGCSFKPDLAHMECWGDKDTLISAIKRNKG